MTTSPGLGQPEASAEGGHTQPYARSRGDGGGGGGGSGDGGGGSGDGGGSGGGDGLGHASPSRVPVVSRLVIALHRAGMAPHSIGLPLRSSNVSVDSVLQLVGTVAVRSALPLMLSEARPDSVDQLSGRRPSTPAPAIERYVSEVRAEKVGGRWPLMPGRPDMSRCSSSVRDDHASGRVPCNPVAHAEKRLGSIASLGEGRWTRLACLPDPIQ